MASHPEGAAQGYVDPNWPPPGEDGDATIIIYGYTPNFALCVLALVLFFILCLAHGWQLFKYRSWYFSTMMVGIAFVRLTLILLLHTSFLAEMLREKIDYHTVC